MTEQNKDGKLSIGAGKLGISGGKLSINPQKFKSNNDVSQKKGQVVVINKGKTVKKPTEMSDEFNNLTAHEKEMRLRVLKEAGQNPRSKPEYFNPSISSSNKERYRNNNNNERAQFGATAIHQESSTGADTADQQDATVYNNNRDQESSVERTTHHNNAGPSRTDKYPKRESSNNRDRDSRTRNDSQKPEEKTAKSVGSRVIQTAVPVIATSERTTKRKKENYKDKEVTEEKSASARKHFDTPGLKKFRGNQIDLNSLSSEDDKQLLDGSDRFRTFKRRNRVKNKGSMNYNKEKIIREVLIPDFISVQELSNRMAEKSATIIKELFEMGIMATLNQSIDADTAELITISLGHKVKRITEAEIETTLINKMPVSEASLKTRPPVVTIMGHVDHGKTSLLDALRSTDVAASEAGGITQHIGAYQVNLQDGRQITFLDTPGHEAFTAMRARGAKVTDIVILVVAADDGIMAQTIEAIHHAQVANVPIIIAINKIDKPGANPQRVKTELLAHGIVSESMGGDTVIAEVSAKTKVGLSLLEEMILLQADILELKVSFEGPAEGSVIESSVDVAKGQTATLLVQQGQLKIGDIIAAGTIWGKIKSIRNDKGKAIQFATPSSPVEVLGLNGAPSAGDNFIVVENEKKAKEIIEMRIERSKNKKFAKASIMSLEQLFLRSGSGNAGLKELNIIVKGDVQGSIEAICSSLEKIGNDEVRIKIIHSAVGGVTESDVTLAGTCGGVIIAFNARATVQAKDLAYQQGVEIRYYSIIYNIIDELKAIMSGMLSPIIKEEYLGTAEIRHLFNITKVGKVAGSYVTDGTIKRNATVHVIRNNIVISRGKIESIKRIKDEVREVRQGFECGIRLKGFDDFKIGDQIEFYETKKESRSL